MQAIPVYQITRPTRPYRAVLCIPPPLAYQPQILALAKYPPQNPLPNNREPIDQIDNLTLSQVPYINSS